MKKLLGIFSALSVTSIIGSSVVSCDFSNRMMKRSIDTNTLNNVFYYTVTSWSTGVSMQAEDAKYLGDIQSTLVRTNNYNMEEGDLVLNAYDVYKEHKSDVDNNPAFSDNALLKFAAQHDTVGMPEPKIKNGSTADNTKAFKTWTYFLNDNATWSNYKGDYVRNIAPEDFVNAVFYALHPSSQSNVKAIVEMFLQGTADYLDEKGIIDTDTDDNNVLTYDFAKIAKDESIDPFQKGTGHYGNNSIYEDVKHFVITGTKKYGNDTYNTLTYKLKTTATYFDTVMTFSVFSPMPKEAINNYEGGVKSGTYYSYGSSYKIPLSSGSYTVTDYDPSRIIVLKKNKNYVHAKDVKIETLQYLYQPMQKSYIERTLFETGDIQNAILNATDSYGWNNYVGSNSKEPRFQGATSVHQPKVVTYGLLWNYANTKATTDDKKAIAAGMALHDKYIRTYLTYNINRSDYIKYFSKADDDSDTSKFLRNIYTARDFAHDNNGKDYGTYYDEQYAIDVAKVGGTKMTPEEATVKLADGSDPYLGNDDNILLLGDSKVKTKKDLINKVREDIKAIESAAGTSISINLLFNGAESSSSGPYVATMVDNFNETAKNDKVNLKMVVDQTLDTSSFQTRLKQTLDYDAVVSGWSPDYADPSTYLNTYTGAGQMNGYFGTYRLFTDDAFKGATGEIDEATALGKISSVVETAYQGYINSDVGKRNLASLYRSFYNYSYNVDKNGNNADIKSRFQQFAEQEVVLNFKYKLLFPLYVKNGGQTVSLTYIHPHTLTTAGYGVSLFRHIGMYLDKKLLTASERKVVDNQYAIALAEAKQAKANRIAAAGGDTTLSI